LKGDILTNLLEHLKLNINSKTKNIMKLFKILPIVLLLFCVQLGFSQEKEKEDKEALEEVIEEVKDLKKEDNTGTNPVNFTYDFRLYQEMQQFQGNGGSQNKTYIEFRAPMGRDIANVKGQEAGSHVFDMGSRWAVRFRGGYNTVNFNDAANTTAAGIGDFDARILMVAKANSKFVIAPGLEAFFDTSSNDLIGSGSTILAPVVFFGWFNALGKNSIAAPGIQHQFSVGGNKVNRTILDLYYVKILSKGKNWLIINPQPIFDWENETEYMVVDVEWGFMIAKAAGIAGSVRPGFGVGDNRPFNYNLEFGVRFIWR
jgi:hypothetical protein